MRVVLPILGELEKLGALGAQPIDFREQCETERGAQASLGREVFADCFCAASALASMSSQ